jgi:hypothetical protein
LACLGDGACGWPKDTKRIAVLLKLWTSPFLLLFNFKFEELLNDKKWVKQDENQDKN